MSAVFDTLKFAKRIKEGGFTEIQAEAQAEALADALRQGGRDFATKGDIAELRMATKADIAELKAEIQAMLNRQLLTLTVIILGSMSILTGIFVAIVRPP
jgi:hypothetical protein